MTPPLLSVIVPVYNVGHYLDQCITSILSQTFRDLELLLIDDGSTDDSPAICDSRAGRDPRVKVCHQENQGQSGARNTGLSLATGRYLSFIDSDDYITPDTLYENLIAQMQAGGYSFAQFPFAKEGVVHNRFDNVAVTDLREIYGLWVNGKRVTNYMCDKIWRRDLFDGLQFRRGMVFEDRYLFADLLNRCRKILLTGFGEYFYRTWPGQITARCRSVHFLESMLRADLHILSVMPRNFSRYRKTVAARMFSTFIELDALRPDSSVTAEVRNSIHLADISSLRMAALRLLGPAIYNRIK